jgi:hypothetical protein
MIDAKRGIEVAKEKAAEMLGQGSRTLEEIERESYKGRDVWSITLSFPRDLGQVAPFLKLTADALQYKRFLIDVETGELLAMKLREVASQ